MQKWEDTMKKNILYLLIFAASYGCAAEDGVLDRAGAAGGGGADVSERLLSQEELDFYSNHFPNNPKGRDSYVRLYNMMFRYNYGLSLSREEVQSYVPDFEIAFGDVKDSLPKAFEYFCGRILSAFHENGVHVLEYPQAKKVNDFLVRRSFEERVEIITSRIVKLGFTFESDEIKDRLEEMKEYLKTPRMSDYIEGSRFSITLDYLDFSDQNLVEDCVRELSARPERAE